MTQRRVAAFVALGGRSVRLVDPLLSHHGTFVISGSGEHEVSIERTR